MASWSHSASASHRCGSQQQFWLLTSSPAGKYDDPSTRVEVVLCHMHRVQCSASTGMFIMHLGWGPFGAAAALTLSSALTIFAIAVYVRKIGFQDRVGRTDEGSVQGAHQLCWREIQSAGHFPAMMRSVTLTSAVAALARVCRPGISRHSNALPRSMGSRRTDARGWPATRSRLSCRLCCCRKQPLRELLGLLTRVLSSATYVR